ncbi:MAG: MFS transporter [Pseudobdellovibrionaceae bacterium]
MSLKLITSDKRFWPLFWTQFFGALNDNVLKNALIVLVTYKGIMLAGLDAGSLVALASGLFILPFFLFSPIAGQLSDKFEKSRLVRYTKIFEVFIMAVAGLGFMTESYYLLLAVLFMAGLQATLFGPVKYSMLPDLVTKSELVEANAYVELGTFLAILIGTIGGGLLVSMPGGEIWLIGTLMVLSFIGVATSYHVQEVKSACPDLKLQYNPFPTIGSTISLLKQTKAIFNSVLGISWFWFFGAAILSLLPIYCKDFLGAGEHVVTAFLAMFTLGIGLGSLLCEKLSFRRVEIGLVPIGSIGMTVFLLDLFLARPDWQINPDQLLGLQEFLATPIGWRLLGDFLLMSIFGGFFILPLYTLIQERSHPETRSRVIAGNNILNAVFMVVSSVLVMGFHAMHLTYPQIFLILAGLNLVVACYIYSIVPEFTLRFLAWVLARTLYRIQCQGEDQVPKDGPAILVCNHVSFVDWLIISALCKRPVRFIMYYKFFDIPVLKYLMKQAKVIPIAGSKEDPKILEAALDKVSAELQAGELICIFPEGEITRTGEIQPFRSGIDKMLARNPVPVIPMALNGLWGTFFSFGGGKAMRKMPRHWLSQVELVIGEPIEPKNVNSQSLIDVVHGLSDLPKKTAS